MRHKYLLFFIFGLLVSCRSSDSKATADAFYDMRERGDYANIVGLLSEKIFMYESRDTIIEKIEALDREMGRVIVCQCEGYDASTIDGITTVKLAYKVIYENGRTHDSLFLQKQEDKYKIYYYYWQKYE